VALIENLVSASKNVKDKKQHFPMKFIEFFVMAMTEKYDKVFKTLLREDHPR